MKCKGEGCKQKCDTGVELCELNLECIGNDCDQTCTANTCKLNCSGKFCKTQKCLKEGGLACEMDLECNHQDCEQICNADKCNLTCSGEKCKTQKCEGEGNVCEMDLECNGRDCDQTCKANRCKMNCSGGKCKTQKCQGRGYTCEMELECQNQDCEQNCNAEMCSVNCNGSKCKTQKCQGNGYSCEMELECNSHDCDQTCDAERCNLTCSGSHCKTQKCQGKGYACGIDLECNSQDCEQICDAEICNLNCSGSHCKKQKCQGKGYACEMELECNSQDCEQTCDAERCNLTCSGSHCKTQKCQGKGYACEMGVECNSQDCEQICDAERCNLTCSGSKCKTQKCQGKGYTCDMKLECNGQDCEQTCDAERCNLNCSGINCKKQHCTGTVQMCNMHCNAGDCIQMCDSTCNITKTWPTSSHDKLMCSGNGQCCKILMLSSKSWSLTTRIFQTVCGQDKSCICTKFPNSHSITSNLSMSNSITSIGASTFRVFATKTSTGHGTETYTLLQSMSQSPLSLVLPSPLLSSPSHSPSAAVLPAGASVYSSALSPLSSKPATRSASVSGSSTAISTARASAASLLLSSSSETSATRSSPSPSLRTPLSLTLEVVKNLEGIWIFEDFITSIQILQKPPLKEEIERIRNSIFKVAVAFEVFAVNYGKHQMIGANSSVEINSRKLVLAIQKTYRKNASDFSLEKQDLQTSLKVSSKNFANNVSVVVGIVYKDLHEVLITDQPFGTITGTTWYLNSRIMAVAMDPKPEKLEANIILKFRNLKVNERKKTCVFWRGFNKSSEGFSGRGCYVVASQSNSEETVCSCNHLTHFAVLLDYNGSSGLTEEDETILEIITYVGLSLSIIGIILTVILYSFLTDVHQPLSQIRLSLSVALGAGQFIFLVGIKATENEASCITAAAFMQYFLMASFCWMLVEGFYLYLFVVKVYNITEKMHMYHVMSWGLPIVTVGISLCIAAGKDGIESFTSAKYCWLSYTNNLIWIFAAFMAFVEVLNILILVRVIKEMTTLVQPMGEDTHIKQIRLGFKTCAVMIPLMGITWLFGLLSPLHKAFAYIFTIFNSTQGFLIFFFHCVRNSQIRERLKRRMNAIFPSSEVGNSARKSSRVNASDAGKIRAVEMQSFDA
nr:adhesion G-protein coupled receptor G2-like [Pocillopora verrucosa]